MKIQSIQRQIIRAKYEAKRRTKKWKKRKAYNKLQRRLQILKHIKIINKGFINLEAPSNFSFIDNSDEVVQYFNMVKDNVESDQPVSIDISKITNLSPDIIILQIAVLKDKKSMRVGLSGNAPEDPNLRKLFIESGLYNFVNSRGKKRVADNNKLWKHSTNNQVKGEIAGEAVAVCKSLFEQNGINYDTDNMYNLLVEAMSNTINHANEKKANINWWLYYFIDESEKKIKYSFVDLGIGIFKSASFDSYRRIANIFVPGNSLLVKPFLEGKIISSRENDNEISGKGVKQIINCANNPEFTKFTIITNDQMINIKDRTNQSLNHNFDGTFIHFEVSYSNNTQNGN
jgi:glycerol-3-phosphate cytidylyltransferase-like family protein